MFQAATADVVPEGDSSKEDQQSAAMGKTPPLLSRPTAYPKPFTEPFVPYVKPKLFGRLQKGLHSKKSATESGIALCLSITN